MNEITFEKCHIEQIARARIREEARAFGITEAWNRYARARHIFRRLRDSAREIRSYFVEVAGGA